METELERVRMNGWYTATRENCTCNNYHLVLQTSQVLVFDLEFSHGSESSLLGGLFLENVKFEKP